MINFVSCFPLFDCIVQNEYEQKNQPRHSPRTSEPYSERDETISNQFGHISYETLSSPSLDTFFFLLFISPINLSISKSEKQMVYRRCKNRVPLDLYRFNDGAICVPKVLLSPINFPRMQKSRISNCPALFSAGHEHVAIYYKLAMTK